ncbi:amidohydrolase family protein [bacterium]|nr:amidohydrolase family protein [bacterium]
MTRTLFENGATLEQGTRWVLVEDGRIADVGDESPPFAEEGVDLGGDLLLPGLINSHTHLYSALAGRLDWPKRSSQFLKILEQVWWRLDRALDENSIRASARLGFAAAVMHGCTTVIDHHSSPDFAEGSLDILAEEAERCGLKLAMAFEVTDRNGAKLFNEGVAENQRAIYRYGSHEIVRALFGLHASFTLSDESLAECAAATDMPFHIHLAEAESDLADARERGYASVVDRLDKQGILREGSLFAHGVHLAPGDADLLAERGCFLAHCPQSNAHNRVGRADVASQRAAGIAVGLGTDGFLSGLLTEARFAAADGAGAARLLYNGGAAIASSIFERSVGRLEPGADADFITLDASSDSPRVNRTVSRGEVLFDGQNLRGVDLAELEVLATLEAEKLGNRLLSL